MREFRRPHDFPRHIIDDGQPGCFAAGVNLEVEPLDLWCGKSFLEDDGERVATEDRCLPSPQQDPCPPRMHRGKRLLVRIEHKNVTHDLFPLLLLRASSCEGNGLLDNVMKRF